jgi:hypothetical protein
VGQVVEVDWEGGQNTVLAPDLAQFLQTVTASLAP